MFASPARMVILAVALGLTYLASTGYLNRPGILERIQDEGELVVVTQVGSSTYYQTQEGPTGLEYDLASRFANELGVKLRLVVKQQPGEILEMLAHREAHFAAAGLVLTPERAEKFMFADPYMTVQPQLVYRTGNKRPASFGEIGPGQLMVMGESHHAEKLRALRQEYPDLRWDESYQLSSADLLYRVWSEQLPYTITDSNQLLLNQRFYPELRAAFDIAEPQPLAWVFPRSDDESLIRAANTFLAHIRADGTLEHLLEKYYGHLGQFDYVGTRTFMRHITERLPKYRPMFEEAAAQHGLDWRLLAAIGYQESHWDPKAVSPTGVRGLMMLTLNTAGMVGVDNRLDPKQSIFGGAKYFASVKRRISERIREPTRTWLALAGYNVGPGHLEDARQLTELQGGDPDSWIDVKEHLPLLAERKWYKRTRYGYARGWEPVHYVKNVRTYYELLVRITEPELMQVDASDESVMELLAEPGIGPNGLRLGAAVESAL